MIILHHDGKNAIKFENTATNEFENCTQNNIQQCLYFLAKKFEGTLLLWCHKDLREKIDMRNIPNVFHHKLILASCRVQTDFIISDEIGFVDQSSFINVQNDVTYPTWLMSSDIGGGYSDVLLNAKGIVTIKQSFDEFLCSFAKFNISKGLLCYSEPNLLKNEVSPGQLKQLGTGLILFNFVRRHYKMQWVFILFLNQLLFNRKNYLFSLIRSLTKKRITNYSPSLKKINIKSTKDSVSKGSFDVDVLIPTLGRKEHLHNVLKDFAKQTILPKKIIVVEQNPVKGSPTELTYLFDEEWPFEIDHTLINQLGACNARNIALSKITSDWVFFADDDIRFEQDLLEKTRRFIETYQTKVLSFSSLQKGEIEKVKHVHQSTFFATCSSFVKADILENCSYKMEHEFGYGEDLDFGMQLIKKGQDVLFIPDIKLLHLKAPIGGFRFKLEHPWSKTGIQPKPSPTVMAYFLKHKSKAQLDGYKFILFLKFYKIQKTKRPLKYLMNINKRWNSSIQWAEFLINKYN